MKSAMADATIVKVHRHDQGAIGGTSRQAIGRSEGGMTTRILAPADALGNLVRFALLPGQCLDTVGVAAPIAGVGFETPIADRVFDSSAILAALEGRGDRAVIPQHPRRAKPPIVDAERD